MTSTTPELTRIPLWRIMRDAQLLAHFHRIQADRVLEREITGGKRPGGMRLSIPDPVRRVKAAFDEEWAVSFDQGVGERGYLCEDLLEVSLFHADYDRFAGRAHSSQEPIRWHTHGVSAFDFVVPGFDGTDRVVSCKSSVNDKKPNSANIAQERRMLTLAGYPAGTVFEVWMIDPSDLEAVGPFEFELEDEHVAATHTEIAGVTSAYAHFAGIKAAGGDPTEAPEWNDPVAWRTLWSLESTSAAFAYTSLDASPAIEARVSSWLRATTAAKAAKSFADDENDALWVHIDEQLALAQKIDPSATRVTAYGADQVVTFSRKSNGARNPQVKPVKKTDAAAA